MNSTKYQKHQRLRNGDILDAVEEAYMGPERRKEPRERIGIELTIQHEFDRLHAEIYSLRSELAAKD